jgi:hypothetical protein
METMPVPLTGLDEDDALLSSAPTGRTVAIKIINSATPTTKRFLKDNILTSLLLAIHCFNFLSLYDENLIFP